MRTFFIGDTHFGHGQVIGFEGRPFTDWQEMDEILIRKWNDTVTDEDRVFMIGDFSFHGEEMTREIGSKLRGHKILVKGNHDEGTEAFYRQCGFESVYSFPIVLDGFWLISHEPLYLNKNMPYANIYGHVHGNEMYKDVSQHSFCACVERNDYAPVEWGEIKRKMAASPKP